MDLVAVKRNNRSPDELTVMLVQVKGGSARVSKDEIARLRRVAKRVRVPWNVARKPAESVRFKKSFGLTSFFWERETKDRRQKRPKNSPTGVT